MSLLEILDESDEVFHVIVLACHQVTATHVQPLELWEPFAKLLLHSVEHPCEVVGSRLAQGMKVEAFNALGQRFQVLGKNAKP